MYAYLDIGEDEPVLLLAASILCGHDVCACNKREHERRT